MVWFPSLNSPGDMKHLHPILLRLSGENFIMQPFTQELSDAKSCDMLLTVDSKASGVKFSRFCWSRQTENGTAFSMTSKTLLTDKRKSRRPRTSPSATALVTNLGSDIKPLTWTTCFLDGRYDENHCKVVSSIRCYVKIYDETLCQKP